GQLRVPVDHLLRGADEVVGVEAAFLVAGADGFGEAVGAGRIGVPEHAVAGGGAVEGHRVGAPAVVPVVAHLDVDRRRPVGEPAVLPPGAEALLAGAPGQVRGGMGS